MDVMTIYELLTSPELYAVLVAFLALLKGAGELLEMIGNLRKEKTWSDKVGGNLLEWVEKGGKFLNYFAPGNKPRK